MAGEEVQIPFRPRLADHVMVRRQVVDGRVLAWLVDHQTSAVYALTESELEHVLSMDGTRDMGGIVLDVVQRGHFRRASDIEQLVGRLQLHKLLIDGIPPPLAPSAVVPARPLEALPGYALRCDGHGACCSSFASVPFSEEEARQAAVTCADRIEGPLDRVFLPLWGSVDRSTTAVSTTDGRCPFVADDGHCLVHQRAGEGAKPLGCRTFPRSYVDDTHAVRVSVRLECPCVLASGLDGPTTHRGTRLVAPTVRDAADLDERVRVLRLPEQIALNRHRKATPTALRTWTQAIMECETSDGVAACWALADAVDDHGLSRDSWADTFAATPPATDALAKPLARLAAEAKLLAQASQARLPSDRTRVLAEWTAAAATSLTDRKTLSARLATVGDATQEQFYLRATFWGYHLVDRGQRLTRALRDRAIRLLLARQMWAAPTAAGTTDVAAAFPLTAVEAMMRGQNLEKYALE